MDETKKQHKKFNSDEINQPTEYIDIHQIGGFHSQHIHFVLDPSIVIVHRAIVFFFLSIVGRVSARKKFHGIENCEYPDKIL